MQAIERNTLKQWMDEKRDITPVEVLAPERYREFHLPGAVNVPLGDDFAERIQATFPDRFRPLVVYCYNERCTASPEAARIMGELGYHKVYDYEAGKMDWKEHGLPVEQGS